MILSANYMEVFAMSKITHRLTPAVYSHTNKSLFVFDAKEGVREFTQDEVREIYELIDPFTGIQYNLDNILL